MFASRPLRGLDWLGCPFESFANSSVRDETKVSFSAKSLCSLLISRPCGEKELT
uniref:Uncharacterized protein n=1 Tax=Anguilla anguilla TaxID=7936 RepID=A0A0E9WQ14_ANGAN